MPIMIAAVAVIGGLCLLDLLLTFGVIRRLREHTNILTGAGSAGRGVIGLAAGQSPGAFSAVTTAGDQVNGATDLRIVAFFSTWCSACPERVPPFVEYLTGYRVARDSVLVVVQGTDSAPPPYLAELVKVARICIEPEDGEIVRAFKVTGFPAFVLLNAGGAVALSGYDPSALPEPATV